VICGENHGSNELHWLTVLDKTVIDVKIGERSPGNGHCTRAKSIMQSNEALYTSGQQFIDGYGTGFGLLCNRVHLPVRAPHAL